MYFYTEISKGKRIDNARRVLLDCDDSVPFGDRCKKRTINKGEKVLVFSNGTIGKGARTLNYSKKEAVKMLKNLIKELES